MNNLVYVLEDNYDHDGSEVNGVYGDLEAAKSAGENLFVERYTKRVKIPEWDNSLVLRRNAYDGMSISITAHEVK